MKVLRINKLPNGIAASIGLVLLLACQPVATSPGYCIRYRHTYAAIRGDHSRGPNFGAGQWSYLADGMYKVHDDNKQLRQLYTIDKNKLTLFKDGQLMKTLDAAEKTAVQVTMLPDTMTVLGYRCKALQMKENGVQTVYYYSPQLRVNPASFAKHTLGGWAAYMKAAQGGLTLKYIVTDTRNNFIMTSEATEIQPLQLAASDFTATAPAR